MPKVKAVATKRPRVSAHVGLPENAFKAKKSVPGTYPEDEEDARSTNTGISGLSHNIRQLMSPIPAIISKPIQKKVPAKAPKERKFQIPKNAFRRMVDDIAKNFRWSHEALEALQFACEDFCISWFEDLNKAAQHAKRQTIMKSR